ncbi:DUF2971 domain-containing protein [Kitasatospora sp. KL5]|uniref:DUF2971 domain-containing protein n=1 Tax=Kitasatospora sp. KL5 TaxID=3425125 RepID=UPI003D70024B
MRQDDSFEDLERNWLLRQVDDEMDEFPSIKPPALPDLVYHYTAAGGLQGIISSASLWASDVEFLNDAQELIYARDCLLSDLRLELEDTGMREHLEAPAGSWHSESWRREVALGLERRDEVRERLGVHKPLADERPLAALSAIAFELGGVASATEASSLRAYTTCFCEHGDLLSQWRAYGGAGGYAIGFRSRDLVRLSQSMSSLRFDKVSYGFGEAIGWGWLPEYLHAGLSLGDYLNALTMVKHPAFREEQEWRLMLLGNEDSEDLKFRISPVGIVPYVSLAFPESAVVEVIVGPGQYAAERAKGVRRLLDSLGMSHVSVEVSLSPLRS